jgi:Domain of unknown function (DUF4411)
VLYLLDANVLIRAHEDYYGLDQVPQFWEWLIRHATAGDVKMPFEIHDEIAAGRGPLPVWIRQQHVKDALILDEQPQADLLDQVMNQYGPKPFLDSDLEKMGRDPILIAYALASAADRVIVTKEVSAPAKKGANRKIPDVCNSLGIKPVKDFHFFRTLGFTTK